MHESSAAHMTSDLSASVSQPAPDGIAAPPQSVEEIESAYQQKLTEMAEEMALINSISSSCLAKQDTVANVLQTVACKLVEALPVDRCRIMTYQKRRGVMTVIAEYGRPELKMPSAISAPLPLTPDQLQCYSPAERTQALLRAQEEAPSWEHRQFYCQYGVQSVLNISLFDGERLIGLLALDCCALAQEFGPRKVRMSQMAADLVANMLIHSRQLRQIREHAHRLAVVNRITATVRATLDLRGVISSVMTEMRQAMEVDECGIGIAPSDQLPATLQYFSTNEELAASDTLDTLEARWMLPVQILDLCSGPARPVAFAALPAGERGVLLKSLPRADMIQSLMLVPIYKQEQFVGLLLLIQTKYQRQFTPAEMDFCQLIANQVGEAIVSAQFHEQVRQQALELAAVNERLRELDRLKSEFLMTMSHELRTPLTSIIGYSDLFIDGVMGELSDAQKDAANAINRGGCDLLRLVNNVLDLSRIEAGQLELKLEAVTVGPCLGETIEKLIPLAQQKGIAVTLAVPPNLAPAWADRERLSQVIANLLSNGIKFNEPGGLVSVRAQLAGQHFIAIHVSDTGLGIPAEQIDWVFQYFTQMENPLTRHHEGTGLGLPIARSLIRLMNGQLRVQSQPNRGSTFTVIIPAEPEGLRTEA